MVDASCITPTIRQPNTNLLSPNGEAMTLIKLIAALGKVKKPDEIDNASLRYVDTMGHTQTVPIAEVIEEIPHGEDGVRRVILVGQI